jgi:replicative DNA helicase
MKIRGEKVLKQLPQNIEAEKEVLGSIIKDNKCLYDVIEIVKAEDFYKDIHNIIYTTMVNMFSKNIPIDMITLANMLGADKVQAVGGITYLSNLVGGIAATSNAKEYAKIIKQKADKRKIIKACTEALETAYQEETDIKKTVAELEDNLMNLGTSKENLIKTDAELMRKTIEVIEENYKNGGGITGIPTGYDYIDKSINGLGKGRFVVIAGRPGMGKSALALNIGQNVSEHSNVLMFSLEMGDIELGIRRLASKTLINSGKMSKGNIEDEEWARLINKADAISSVGGMYTCDSGGITLHDIKAQAKKVKIKHGLDVIIVDHIGLITSTLNTENKVRQMEEITRFMKMLAKELDVCVIGLSQLSRDVERRPDKRPVLSDLRDSGTIEQDADVVLLAYRDEYYNAESEEKNVIELNIAKNRTGRTGVIKLAWRGEYQKITNLSI